MRYKLVIFDMDGTILNTLDDLADSLNAVLASHGYAERSLEEVRQFVGNGIRKLIERAVPKGVPEKAVDKVHEDFLEYYQKHCADKTKPYDGIVELLQTLRGRGCRTAVVSNKADSAVQELCRDYFDGLFDMAVGERGGLRRKPAPDAVEYVLKEMHVEKGEAIYVGDSEVDVQTAQNMGMDSVIALWGFRDRTLLEQYGATVFAENPGECLERFGE